MPTDTITNMDVKTSGYLPVATTPPEVPAEAQDFINVSGEQLEFGLRKYAPEFQSDLRWYFRWSLGERKMSMADIAKELDVDTSTVSRVMRGVYPGLKPPAKMMSRVRILRQQEAARVHMENQGRVMTPTVKKIWTVCRKAWNDRLIAMIFGPPHVGKSEALKWFREENNHGATIYVDLQGITGVQALYKEFARALLLSTNVPFEKLKARVLETISKTTLVLIDEYHFITYAYLKTSAKRMVSEIKSIHDRTGCGMVICSTDIARADFENGPEQKLNEQLWRRGTIKLQLPDAVPVCDLREIVKAYGLAMPDGPEKETWLKYRERNRDFAPVSVLEDIARNQGVLSLVMTLKDAKLLASKADHELRWDDVLAVQRLYADQLERKHA